MPGPDTDDPQASSDPDEGPAHAGAGWGKPSLYGGQLYDVLDPPPPRVTQTGSWSEPYFPADPEQDGDALQGALAIQRHWQSKKGGVYAVDPKTMGMEHGIDIGQQIQASIDQGGYMRGVLDQANKTGRPVSFDSSKWGLKPFDDHPPTPDGITVGRWGGFVQGKLATRPDGTWTVDAGLWPQKTGQFDLDAMDASGNEINRLAGNAMIWGARKLIGPGAAFWINFNRTYRFQANGKYR